MTKLDDKDHLLIDALRKNARASLVSLARSTGLSRSATHDRMIRLEGAGVIVGYTAVLADAAAPQHRAYLTVRYGKGQDNLALAKVIARMPDVTAAHCVTGTLDLIVQCACASATQLLSLREGIAAISGVEEVATFTILRTHRGG